MASPVLANNLETAFAKNPRISLAPLRLETAFRSDSDTGTPREFNLSSGPRSTQRTTQRSVVRSPPRSRELVGREVSGRDDTGRWGLVSADHTPVLSLDLHENTSGKFPGYSYTRRLRDTSSGNINVSRYRGGRGSLTTDDPELVGMTPSRVRRTLRLDSIQPSHGELMRDRGTVEQRPSKSPSSITHSHRSLSPILVAGLPSRRRLESEGAGSPMDQMTVDMSPSPLSLTQYPESSNLQSFLAERNHSQSAFGTQSERQDRDRDSLSEVTQAVSTPDPTGEGTQPKKKKGGWKIGKLFGGSSKKKPQQIPIPNANTPIDLTMLQQPIHSEEESKSTSRRSSRLMGKLRRSSSRSRAASESSRTSGSARSRSTSSFKNLFRSGEDKEKGDKKSTGGSSSSTGSRLATKYMEQAGLTDTASDLSLMPPREGDSMAAKRKKKAWYQKMWGSGKRKAGSSHSRSVSFVGDPQVHEMDMTDHLEHPAQLHFPQAAIPHMESEIPRTDDKSDTKKSKKSGWSLWGSGKKKKKEKEPVHQSAHFGAPGVASEEDLSGIGSLYEESAHHKPSESSTHSKAPVEVTAEVVITEQSISAEEQVRLARLRDETREEFLNTIRDLQKRFFIRQGKHCMWKYQSLRQLLARDYGPKATDLKATQKQEWDDFQLEEFMQKQADTKHQELKAQAAKLLQTSRTLVQVGNSGKLQDLKRVDWRVVDVQEQVDAMRVAFSLTQVTKVVHAMFDEEEFRQALKGLFQSTDDQIESWVSQGYLNGPDGSSTLGVEEWKRMGHLRQGKMILEHMDELMGIAALHAHETYYTEMQGLAEEIDVLRTRITELVEMAFEYLKANLLPDVKPAQTSVWTGNVISEIRYYPPLPNDQTLEFNIPKFLRERLRILPAAPKPVALSTDVKKIPDNLYQKKEIMLRRLTGRNRQPVADGFLLTASRQDMEEIERRLAGKWGSYNLFEKWLQDAMKWQLQDVALQDRLRNNKIEVEGAIEIKKQYVKDILDKRLAQLWAGRALDAKAANVERLTKYLSEAIAKRPPVIITASGRELEQISMQLEDERSRVQRLLSSNFGRELVRNMPQYKKELVTLTTTQDVVKMQDVLRDIQKALERDYTIIGDIELQTNLEDMRKEVAKIKQNVDEIRKQRATQEASLERQKETLEKERKAVYEALDQAKEELVILEDDHGVEDIDKTLKEAKAELEDLKVKVKAAQAESKVNKAKFKNLEKEYKATKKKLMDEQKALEKAEKEAEASARALEKERKKYEAKLKGHGLDPSRLGESSIRQSEGSIRHQETGVSEIPRTEAGSPRTSLADGESRMSSDSRSEITIRPSDAKYLEPPSFHDQPKKKKRWWGLGGTTSSRKTSESARKADKMQSQTSSMAETTKSIHRHGSLDHHRQHPESRHDPASQEPGYTVPIVYKEEPLVLPPLPARALDDAAPVVEPSKAATESVDADLNIRHELPFASFVEQSPKLVPDPPRRLSFDDDDLLPPLLFKQTDPDPPKLTDSKVTGSQSVETEPFTSHEAPVAPPPMIPVYKQGDPPNLTVRQSSSRELAGVRQTEPRHNLNFLSDPHDSDPMRRRQSDFPVPPRSNSDRRYSTPLAMADQDDDDSDLASRQTQKSKKKPLWKKLVKGKTGASKGSGKKEQMSSQVDDLLGQRLSEAPPLPPGERGEKKKKSGGWGWLGMGKRKSAKRSDSNKTTMGGQEPWRSRLGFSRSGRDSDASRMSSFDASVASMPVMSTDNHAQRGSLNADALNVMPMNGSFDSMSYETRRDRSASVDYIPGGPHSTLRSPSVVIRMTPASPKEGLLASAPSLRTKPPTSL